MPRENGREDCSRTKYDIHSNPYARLTLNADSALLVATYNADGVLRIHRVKVDIERSKFDIHHIEMYVDCSPHNGISNGVALIDDAPASCPRLILLDFVPPGPRPGSKEATPPFVLAAFSNLSDNYGHGVGQTSPSTTLCKWELQKSISKLHTNFSSLSTKKTPPSTQNDFTVRPRYL